MVLSLPFVQIDKIMSSIGAGIGSGLDIKEDASGEICRRMYVWVCELFGFKDNSGVLGFIQTVYAATLLELSLAG